MRNPVLQTVFLEDCPIQQAAFTGGGGQLVAAGRRPHFYVYDMVAAKVLAGPCGALIPRAEYGMSGCQTAG